MTQSAGEGLHIYAVLHGQSREKMSHVVEPHMFRTNGLENFIVGPAEGIRVVHCPGFGGGEHIGASRVPFMFFDQKVHRLLGDCQCPYRVLRFRRTNYQFPFDSIDLLCNGNRPGLDVQV